MNLFIDSISSPASLIIFNKEREIKSHKKIDIAFNESSKLSKEIFLFLQEHSLSYNDLENVTVIHWPWSFTWVRTVALIANSIAFQRTTVLTALTYFELFSQYPIVKTSSKRDVFLKKSLIEEVEILSNEKCEEYLNNIWKREYYGDFDKIEKKDIIQVQEPDYVKIIKTLILQNEKMIQPYYIKKPTIS